MSLRLLMTLFSTIAVSTFSIEFGIGDGAVRTSVFPTAAASPLYSPLDLFRDLYPREGEIYRANQCGRNVKELLYALHMQGFDINQSKVLFLLNEKRQVAGGPFLSGPLLPARSRLFSQAWDFHVVLVWQDAASGRKFVLDLDGPYEPMELGQAFDAMFPTKGPYDRLAMIAAREIDVRTYLAAFGDPNVPSDDLAVVGSFRALDRADLPVIPLRDFINQSAYTLW